MNTCTDLVLLVGINPLPNYVVAEYFLKTNQAIKNIRLVHSEEVARQGGTKTQAENLEKVLKERHCNKTTTNCPLLYQWACALELYRRDEGNGYTCISGNRTGYTQRVHSLGFIKNMKTRTPKG